MEGRPAREENKNRIIDQSPLSIITSFLRTELTMTSTLATCALFLCVLMMTLPLASAGCSPDEVPKKQCEIAQLPSRFFDRCLTRRPPIEGYAKIHKATGTSSRNDFDVLGINLPKDMIASRQFRDGEGMHGIMYPKAEQRLGMYRCVRFCRNEVNMILNEINKSTLVACQCWRRNKLRETSVYGELKSPAQDGEDSHSLTTEESSDDEVRILPIDDDEMHILPILDDNSAHILPVDDDDHILPIDDDDSVHILPVDDDEMRILPASDGSARILPTDDDRILAIDDDDKVHILPIDDDDSQPSSSGFDDDEAHIPLQRRNLLSIVSEVGALELDNDSFVSEATRNEFQIFVALMVAITTITTIC